MTSPQSVLRRFTTRFHSRNSELLVYCSFALGCFCLLIGYTSSIPSFFLISVVCFVATFYYQPFLDTETAQLGADTRGIYIRGLGHIPWFCIEAFRVQRISVRLVENAVLQVKLKDDWQEHITCKDHIPLAQRFMYRTWKKRPTSKILEVRLEHFLETPSEIDESFNEIWSNSAFTR